MKSLILLAVLWILCIIFPKFEMFLNIITFIAVIGIALKFDAMIKEENSKK